MSDFWFINIEDRCFVSHVSMINQFQTSTLWPMLKLPMRNHYTITWCSCIQSKITIESRDMHVFQTQLLIWLETYITWYNWYNRVATYRPTIDNGSLMITTDKLFGIVCKSSFIAGVSPSFSYLSLYHHAHCIPSPSYSMSTVFFPVTSRSLLPVTLVEQHND